MKRILVRAPGGHEALELIEEPDPRPGPGQLGVKVAAAGINYADVAVRLGYYEAAKGLYPMTPGFEWAGTVDALGAGTTGFKEGDRVFGFTRFGGYASRLVLTPDHVFPCPEGWSFAECAGFPAVFFTAYHGLHEVAKVSKGESVLIHSAAGGVGTALIQLCRIHGCRPIAVVGAPHKVAVCRSLGAETVIDRSAQDLWTEVDRAAPKGLDAIFDANGVTTVRPGFERLAQGGRLVVYGFAEIIPRGKGRPRLWDMAWNYLRVPRFSPLEMTHTNRAVMGFNVVFLFHKLHLAQKAMGEMLGWIREGKIKKVPVTTFPFDAPAAAHAALESGTTTGKLVLTL